MSTNINRDWPWLSLFGPGNMNGTPSMEGNFLEDYEVEEEYIETEIIDTEENDDDDVDKEVEGMLIDYDDDEED